MDIGFYGHSNCAYRSPESLIDIFALELNANIVNIGVRQGSEERILFELKKTKKLDLAVIFHSQPHFIFIPEADRDISIRQITNSKTNYIFKEHLDHYHKTHHKKFVELFKTAEELENAYNYMKKYFYNQDLQLNRFYGSLIQIDQYLCSKGIPVIHITTKNTLPNWFTFQSGVVDYQTMEIIKQNQIKHGQFFVNMITKEGNIQVAEHLTALWRNFPQCQLL